MFESYSTKIERDAEEGGNQEKEVAHVINRANSIQAYKDIFKTWGIKLNDEAMQRIAKKYFNQAWKKLSEQGSIDVKDSYSFLKELMTTPLDKRKKKP